ncbi:hypothetical protein ANCDUO_16045 [Ancylostoma duodenale]|uniref:C2H2-type domain-containing protein n=1 Tax=Ancylostoma duodenale TaxID=51022 RepID=A0A0C2G4F0_9BILA|nr:hypothetical protein ANCDUO_16045 [Ancylostoma duodenale]
MVSFVLVEAETQDVLLNLLQFLAGYSLKFTVASDLRRLFARTYLDVEGYGAADVSSSSENVPASRTDVNTTNDPTVQVHNAVPNMFELVPKSEPQSFFAQWTNVSGHVGSNESMNSELLCGESLYMDTYPSVNGSSLESSAHQTCAAEATTRAPKRTKNHQNSSVQAQLVTMKKDEGVEKKEKLGEVVCQICGKRITMRRGNLRHHAAVVHSGIERFVNCPN